MAEEHRKGAGRLPLSARVFVSLILCVVALSYISFLAGIWVETEWKIPLIAEGYGDYSTIELIDHTRRYAGWFILVFGVTTPLLFMTSCPERVKRVLGVTVPLAITSDIGSAWLIRYDSIFAVTLFISGFVLASSFLVMFAVIQRELWFGRS